MTRHIAVNTQRWGCISYFEAILKSVTLDFAMSAIKTSWFLSYKVMKFLGKFGRKGVGFSHHGHEVRVRGLGKHEMLSLLLLNHRENSIKEGVEVQEA